MSVQLYMDVHIPDAIRFGMRLCGVDVLTAQEDGARRLSDAQLLDRVAALGRVLFSQDEDLLREAASGSSRLYLLPGYLCPSTQGDHWAVCEGLGTARSRWCT